MPRGDEDGAVTKVAGMTDLFVTGVEDDFRYKGSSRFRYSFASIVFKIKSA